MARRVTATKDPLAPVETIVQVTLCFIVVSVLLLLAIGGIQLATTGETDLTFSAAEQLCGQLYDGLPGSDGSDDSTPAIDGLRPGSSESVTSYEICTDDPSATVRVVGAARLVGSLGLLVGMPFLLLRVITRARRSGLFAPETATAVRRLGWVLLAVAVVGPVLQALANGVVLAELLEWRSWYGELGRSDFSWSLLVTALGVITVGRVLAHAVLLQEDVDATI